MPHQLCAIAAKFPKHRISVGIDWKSKSIHLKRPSGRKRAMSIETSCSSACREVHGRRPRHRFAFGGRRNRRSVALPPRSMRSASGTEESPDQRTVPDRPASACYARPGASLCLKTDHPGYYQWTLSLLGLPQPMWFASRQAEPGKSTPGVKWREVVTVTTETLPAAGDAVLRAFQRCR